MQLTPQQFGSILSNLRGGGSSSRGSEQRRHSRIRVRARVAVASMDNAQAVRSYSVLTSDISISGIAVMQSTVAAAGSHLLVRLPRQESPAITILCTVSRCSQLADGLYCVGAQFVQEITSGLMRPPLAVGRADERA